MQRCEVTGRIHRNPRELRAELVRLDTAIARLKTIEKAYDDFYVEIGPLGDDFDRAVYACYDALAALQRERDDVDANPRPIPGYEAETYKLVAQNID